MTRLVDTTDRAGSTDFQSAFIILECANQLITEGTLCGDIRSGLWLFVARLGEGYTVKNPAFENTLWTAAADIDVEAAPQPREHPVRCPCPAANVPPSLKSGLVIPHPDSVCLHRSNTDMMEHVLTFDGAGIAVCLNRNSAVNDDLIWSLTCVLEPRHPDDTGPMVWYGQPPRPPGAPASNGGSS